MTVTTIPEWTLGDRLRKSRQNAGISTALMAEHFNKSEQAINAWEKDTRTPGRLLTILAEWAELTGTDYTWLVTGRNITSAGASSTWSFASNESATSELIHEAA